MLASGGYGYFHHRYLNKFYYFHQKSFAYVHTAKGGVYPNWASLSLKAGQNKLECLSLTSLILASKTGALPRGQPNVIEGELK